MTESGQIVGEDELRKRRELKAKSPIDPTALLRNYNSMKSGGDPVWLVAKNAAGTFGSHGRIISMSGTRITIETLSGKKEIIDILEYPKSSLHAGASLPNTAH